MTMLPFEIERNAEEIRRQVESLGAELVEISFRRGPGKAQLVIVADKAGGISLDDCAEISRQVGRFLDSLDEAAISATPYDLEVVSPGLDRPLKNQRDFSRAVGDLVKVSFKKDDGSSATWTGRLIAADSDRFELQLKDGAIKQIQYSALMHAAREIVFGMSKPKKK